MQTFPAELQTHAHRAWEIDPSRTTDVADFPCRTANTRSQGMEDDPSRTTDVADFPCRTANTRPQGMGETLAGPQTLQTFPAELQTHAHRAWKIDPSRTTNMAYPALQIANRACKAT